MFELNIRFVNMRFLPVSFSRDPKIFPDTVISKKTDGFDEIVYKHH